jgi:peptidoglycan/LPS O-acetylase OafA/YrhL
MADRHAAGSADPAAFPAAHGVAYRPEIDGMRAIAVMSVILYHSALGGFTGGYVGVDIFFVISGYLIGSIIMGDIARGRFSFANFYERRIRRIAPPLFLVLAVSSVFAVWLLTPHQLREFGQALIATVTFLSNIYFRMKTGYFGSDTENNPLIHMWSLSVEEQFYLFFPVVLIVAGRWRALRLEWVLPLLFALSLGWCLYRSVTDPSGGFFPAQTRAWELLAGAIVAVYRARWMAFAAARSWFGNVVELTGAAAMIVPIFVYTSLTVWPGIATVPVVLGAAAIILASHERSIVGRLLSIPPMVGIGLISYSAYLWHQPLFAFARAALSTNLTVGQDIVLICITLVLAWLSWRFVERPFRKSPSGRHWRVFAVAGAMSALLLAVGAFFHFTQGLPGRFDKQTLALQATTAPSPMRAQCHTEGLDFRTPDKACRFFGKDVTWAVLGDSHGVEISYALAEDLRRKNEGLIQLTFSGCQPALKFESPSPGCSAWLEQATKYLEGQPNVTNVMLTFRHPAYLYGDMKHSYPVLPDAHPNFLFDLSAEAARQAYWNSFAELVTRLRRAGKQVYILAPIPELPVLVDRYIFRGAAAPAVPSRGVYERRNGEILAKLAAFARQPGVTVLDPSTTMCGRTDCAAIIDRQALYFDDNHLSAAGARRFIALQRASGALP